MNIINSYPDIILTNNKAGAVDINPGVLKFSIDKMINQYSTSSISTFKMTTTDFVDGVIEQAISNLFIADTITESFIN